MLFCLILELGYSTLKEVNFRNFTNVQLTELGKKLAIFQDHVMHIISSDVFNDFVFVVAYLIVRSWVYPVGKYLFTIYQSYLWYQWRPFLSPLTPVASICEYWTTLL